MPKINISLPDSVLDEIDRRADSVGASRSGFLRDAAAHYIAELDDQAQRQARTRRISRAVDKMRSIAPAVGAPDGTKVIRELRDRSPRWDRT